MIKDFEIINPVLSKSVITQADMVVVRNKVDYAFWSGEEDIAASVPFSDTRKSFLFKGTGDIFNIQNVVGDTQLGFKNVSLDIQAKEPNIKDFFTSNKLQYSDCYLITGFFDPINHNLLGAIPLLTGTILGAEEDILDGNNGSISLVIYSTAYQLSLNGDRLRTHIDQQKRLSSDSSFLHTASIGERKISWGKVEGEELRSNWDVFLRHEHWVK